LTLEEAKEAVAKGYETLNAFNTRARRQGRQVLERRAAEDRPCLLVVAPPYHMDPGIGHEKARCQEGREGRRGRIRETEV
jgi:predicted nucleotide-binding protein (sugar kinase/HSP70/actin superfamily)